MNVVVEIFSICTGYLSSHPEPIGGVIHSVDQLDRDHTGSWQEQFNMFHVDSDVPDPGFKEREVKNLFQAAWRGGDQPASLQQLSSGKAAFSSL